MEPADPLDEKTASLAAKYSLAPDRVRHALLQAEDFRFWRFRHHGLMKTEDALAVEIASVKMDQNCQRLLRPSLEDALGLCKTAHSDWLDLFLNAEPWEVRQRRILLLGFVPYSDAPFYNLHELADVLEGFLAEQNSEAAYLTETGRMVATPSGEGWAKRVLGALYPDWPGLTPVCPRLREAVLGWRTDFVQSLVPDIGAAARHGDRADRNAASKLWEASRSRLRDILGNVEYQEILQREVESLVRETCIGLGSISRMALLAAHCSAEIASGSYRKTRSILGPLIILDDLRRPRLVPERHEPLVSYEMMVERAAGSQGERVAKAVSQYSRRAVEEAMLLKGYINDYVGLIEEAVRKANLPGTQDGELRKKAEGRLKQEVHRIRSDYRTRVASVLELSLPECPRPLRIPADPSVSWVDVTLRLEGVDTLVVEIGKAVPPVCQTRRFEELTFRDTRSEDEVRPNELWLMLAGILKHAAASDGAGRQSFQLSLENNRFADAERTSERQLLKEVTAKLRELLGMKDEAAPPFKSRKGGSRQHAYEIMFRVEVPRGDTTPRRLWTPGCRVLKKSDRQHGRRSLRIPRDRGAI